MTLSDTKTRIIALLFIIGLLASLAVAAFRLRTEQHAKRVELAMDYGDFVSLARSYGYNTAAFLVALRRSGLTSIALTEELGQNVGDSGLAYASTGAALLNQARLSPLSDPLLESLAKSNAIQRDAMYVIVFDKPTYERYLRNLDLHFEKKTVRVLRASKPWIIEVRTQIDYFNNTGLGIPDDQLALAKRLHLLVIARFQNDERWQQPQFEAAFDNVIASGVKVSDVVFFGLRNQVFGFPDEIPAAALAFKAHDAKSAHPLNFGSIETYDASQVQKGNDALGRLLPNQTVRVQAIAKLDQDKIKLDEAIGRYVLGVRERNVRVVYLRPWGHQDPGLSIEATNIKYIHSIAQELVDHGFKLGRATPIPAYRGDNPILIALAALAVPSIFALLLIYFGWFRLPLVLGAYLLTELVYGAGAVSHHDIAARSAVALVGVMLFAAAAFLSVASAFTQEPAENMRDQIVRSVGATLVAVAIALCGALVVVGMMSSPVAMQEIEPMRGVKAVLLLPPLIALAIYLFSGRYGTGVKARDVLNSPVLLAQLLLGIVVIAAGALLVMRSGNQSDISPSNFELAARHFLGNVLGVRPRQKLFLVGIPFLMLAPALLSAHRKVVGWIFALAIGVGIGDVIDTFSHLHTPLLISTQRVFNGVVIGAIIGVLLIWIYRRACITFGLLRIR